MRGEARDGARAAAPLRRVCGLEGRTMLVCIGAMKAATSWLFAQLRTMPEVAVSPLKEVHFLDAKFGGTALAEPEALAVRRLEFHLRQPGDPAENLRSRPAFRASVDRLRMIYDDSAYFEHFAGLAGPRTQVFADITPAYACIGEAGFRYLRDACVLQGLAPRLVFILRDPVDRLWSHLRFLPQLNRDLDPVRDWQAMLDDPAVAERSDYRATIRALDQVFAPQEVTVLFYETLFGDGFAGLCRGLGVPLPAVDAAARFNRTKLEAEMPEAARRAASGGHRRGAGGQRRLQLRRGRGDRRNLGGAALPGRAAGEAQPRDEKSQALLHVTTTSAVWPRNPRRFRGPAPGSRARLPPRACRSAAAPSAARRHSRRSAPRCRAGQQGSPSR